MLQAFPMPLKEGIDSFCTLLAVYKNIEKETVTTF